MRNNNIFLLFLLVVLLLASCAKRGSITGGDKDVTPPKIISSNPKNFSTQFDKKEIKITFDEYIKIKDLQKNLIVSPPMKNPITVLPQGGVSKNLIIKINDTLKAKTTYSFNFGQSIIDNNEGNVFPQLKYVFSTGAELDSLTVEGTIKDSYEKEIPNFVNVMLYEVDENYNDSILYKEVPRYITNTLDSTKTFKIENIKAGNYKLVALKEGTTNYKFDPKKDRIGFYDQTISVPDKAIFELELFKEVPKFEAKKPTQASANRVLLGYEGNYRKSNVKIKHNNQDIAYKVTKFADKDSLQLWFKPLKNDSIAVNIENGKYNKDFVVKIKNQRQDSLKLTSKNTLLDFKGNFKINTTVPLEKFDVSKMSLIKKDSSKVNFITNYDEFNQNLEVIFDKEENEKYTFEIQPNAVEDYLGQKNDSLVRFSASTKNKADYGNLKLVLQNTKSFPLIVELTDDKGKVLYTEYAEKNPTVEFLLIEPRKYSIRVVYDTNSNKERDTGSYLDKRQPEEVYHFPTEIDVRANWDVEQALDLGK
ncbi:MAG: Ig-like domain-containing protein [Bacteroidota bacterium]